MEISESIFLLMNVEAARGAETIHQAAERIAASIRDASPIREARDILIPTSSDSNVTLWKIQVFENGAFEAVRKNDGGDAERVQVFPDREGIDGPIVWRNWESGDDGWGDYEDSVLISKAEEVATLILSKPLGQSQG